MRPLQVFITESAAVAIREASDWWAENRQGASTTVHEELERALTLISAQPGVGALARNIALQGLRRVHLSRIHYHLYYRVLPNDTVLEVLAFWHVNRGTEPDIPTDA